MTMLDQNRAVDPAGPQGRRRHDRGLAPGDLGQPQLDHVPGLRQCPDWAASRSRRRFRNPAHGCRCRHARSSGPWRLLPVHCRRRDRCHDRGGARFGVIDNGGDIALVSDRDVRVGVHAGTAPLSDKIAFVVPPHNDTVWHLHIVGDGRPVHLLWYRRCGHDLRTRSPSCRRMGNSSLQPGTTG